MGGGGYGVRCLWAMNTRAPYFLYTTHHIVKISATELYSLMKIFLMVFKIEGIVDLTIKRR